jgi:hypothetical protein
MGCNIEICIEKWDIIIRIGPILPCKWDKNSKSSFLNERKARDDLASAFDDGQVVLDRYRTHTAPKSS